MIGDGYYSIRGIKILKKDQYGVLAINYLRKYKLSGRCGSGDRLVDPAQVR